MGAIRQHRGTDRKIVVRGTPQLAEVWPGEGGDVRVAAPAAEVGGVDAVVELLASIDGEEPSAYRARHGSSGPALRALAAHCRAAILQAAMRAHGDLSPEAVLAELHASLRTPIASLVDRVAS